MLARWLAAVTVAGSFGAAALWWGGGSLPGRRPTGTAVRRSEVVAASAAGAPVAGRRHGFPYGAEPSPEEARELRRQLLHWRDRYADDLKRGAGPRVQWEAALVELAAGAPERAVEFLEAAVAAADPALPDRPQLLNDLAVAYLARGEKLGQPHDLARALDASGRAAEAAPDLPEPCFNQALAMERLHMARAEAAWAECERLETDPQWRSMAVRHRKSIRRPSLSERWRGARAGLARAAKTADRSAVEDAVAVHPQGAREEAIEVTLADWGTAVLQGKEAQAEAALDQARQVGEALIGLDADHTVAEAVQAVERATGARRTALARGLVLYREARRLYRRDEFEASAPLLEQARDLLREGGCPVWLSAELSRVVVSFYRNDFDDMLVRLASMKPFLEEEHHPVLAGHWHWLAGMARARRYELQESFDELRAALAQLDRTREVEQRGAGYQLVGEAYRLLGDEDEAWRNRGRALDLLRDVPASRRRLVLLRDITDSLLAEGLVQAALAVRAEAVEAAAGGTPRDRAEALLWSARVLARQGRLDEAAADAVAAEEQAEQIPAGGLRGRTQVDVAFAEADIAAERDPAQALALLDGLVDSYRNIHHVLPLTAALARRAEVAGRLNLRDRQLADLAEGLALFEGQWRDLAEEKDRLTSLQTAQKLFDASLQREVEEGAAAAALAISERSRAFWTGDPGSLDTSWIQRLAPLRPGGPCTGRAGLPPGVVVLEYARVESRLILWLLRCDGLRMVPLKGTLLDELAGQFREAAQTDAAASGRFQELAEVLYDLLLRPVADDLPADAALVVVPDRALHGLPFGALRDRNTGRYLLEDREIALAPSASFLRAALRRPAPASPAGDVLIARPPAADLAAAEPEVADLRRLYPEAVVLAGSDATKADLLAALDRHRLFHYVGHADVLPSDPFHARLRLGSGEITLRDLQGRRFERLDLVVLSACSTVAAEPSRTGGFLGLARPFLSGGARAVVGTLWDVVDADSRAVLVAFHRELAAGRSPAAALRAAQLEVLKNEGPPSAWAAFTVVGEGLRSRPLER